MSAKISVAAMGEMTITPARSREVRFRSSTLPTCRRWASSIEITRRREEKQAIPRNPKLQIRDSVSALAASENGASAAAPDSTPLSTKSATRTPRSCRARPTNRRRKRNASAVPMGDATMSRRCQSRTPVRW